VPSAPIKLRIVALIVFDLIGLVIIGACIWRGFGR